MKEAEAQRSTHVEDMLRVIDSMVVHRFDRASCALPSSHVAMIVFHRGDHGCCVHGWKSGARGDGAGTSGAERIEPAILRACGLRPFHANGEACTWYQFR